MTYPAANPAAKATAVRTRDLLYAPLLPTLLRLATPNIFGLIASTVEIGHDGYLLGSVPGGCAEWQQMANGNFKHFSPFPSVQWS